MTSKSQRNEEAVQHKEPKVWKDPSKKRDKSMVREPSCSPSLGSRSAGEEGEGADNSQLDEKIIGVEAGLSSLYRRLVFIEKNFSSLEIVAFEGLDELKSKIIDLEEVNKERLTNP